MKELEYWKRAHKALESGGPRMKRADKPQNYDISNRIQVLQEYAREEGLMPPSAHAIAALRFIAHECPLYFTGTPERLPGVFLSDAGGLELVFESKASRKRSEVSFVPSGYISIWLSNHEEMSQLYSDALLKTLLAKAYEFVWGPEVKE